MAQKTSDFRALQINADDFAQSEAIDTAIINLANHNIISSTSALVLSPRWPQAAKQLLDLPLQVGLHLDLTSDFTKKFDCYYPLPKLIFLAYSRQLNIQALEKTIELQWNVFVDALGRPPDFIDGHQHVHQLPVVRDALFSVIEKKSWGLQKGHWLRNCQSSHFRDFKAAVISMLGAQYFRKKAQQLGINTNSDFAGVYNFNANANLKKMWANWLTDLSGETPLMMCHVAVNENSNAASNSIDAIYHARVNEYNWLMSDDFKQLLHSKSCLYCE